MCFGTDNNLKIHSVVGYASSQTFGKTENA